MNRKILVIVASLLAALVLCLAAFLLVQKRPDGPEVYPMDTAATVASEETQDVTTEDTVETEATETTMDADLALEEVPAEMTQSTENTEPADSTKPAGNKNPSGGTKPTENTKPAETTKPAESTQPSKPAQGGKSAYETYMSMSPDEQKAFRATFGSTAEFFAWYNAAKAEHEKNDDTVDVGNGTIDLEDAMNGSAG